MFRTGVSDRETNADINTAPATTIPNSLNSLPTNPCKKMIGKNTTAKVKEVETTAKKISLELMKRDVAEISELRDGPITLALLNKLDKAKDLIRNESLSKN